MTHEAQQRLNQQLAEALDAAGLGEFAYSDLCIHCGIGGQPQDFSDATTLLAAVEAWITQRPEGRTITTEWWANAKKWVCKITEFRYLLCSIVSIGEHQASRTLAEAQAFLAVLTATTAGAIEEATDDAGQ